MESKISINCAGEPGSDWRWAKMLHLKGLTECFRYEVRSLVQSWPIITPHYMQLLSNGTLGPGDQEQECQRTRKTLELRQVWSWTATYLHNIWVCWGRQTGGFYDDRRKTKQPITPAEPQAGFQTKPGAQVQHKPVTAERVHTLQAHACTKAHRWHD